MWITEREIVCLCVSSMAAAVWLPSQAAAGSLQALHADEKAGEKRWQLVRATRERISVRCMSENMSSPKRGAVGLQRFKESAMPGMYWGDRANLGENVSVKFTTGSESVTVAAQAGENLLKVAERCGAMLANSDFCFEGTCCHCEMEVLGGAKEVGYRAEVNGGSLVRSCLCPVPAGRGSVEVKIINSEDGWDDSVV